MKTDTSDFHPFMKVSLKGECGVVTEQFWEINDSGQEVTSKLYGVIRWDTNKTSDYEDWRGLWGTFITEGGKEIDKDYTFQFINDDGNLKT